MDLAKLLRELRLLNGQQGYRYCMAWAVVVTHLLARPTLIFLVLWTVQKFDHGTAVGKFLSSVAPMFARVLGKYLQSA